MPAAPFFLMPASDAQRDWFLFLGSFHSLVVHFPIALVYLALVLEIYAGRRRDVAVRETMGFILLLVLISSLVAPLFGWMLARAEDYSGRLVESHMWAGGAVPILCALALVFHRANLRVLYLSVLTLAVGAVTAAGFLGGQMAHGQNHLTAHMPDGLRALLGVERATPIIVDTATYFGGRVYPIMSTRCISCHGPQKSKGQLRLDTFEAIMKGGRGGAVVIPGDVAASELYRRITLDAGHDDFMPRGNNPPLSIAETEIIRQWIEDGAESSTPITVADDESSVAPTAPHSDMTMRDMIMRDVVIPASNPDEVRADRRQLADQVSALQIEYPDILAYESRSSADLELNAAMKGESFGDADTAAFSPVASRIVRADFTGTSITEASGDLILSMTRLKKLRIGRTAVSDPLIAQLSSLPALESFYISDPDIAEQPPGAVENARGGDQGE